MTEHEPMQLARVADPGDGSERRQGLLATGGVLGAVAASSCCLVPLLLLSAGASGAWIGNLTAMMPYQWIFILITVGFLATGFTMVRRRARAEACGEAVCASPASRRFVKSALWGASALVLVAAVYPYLAPVPVAQLVP